MAWLDVIRSKGLWGVAQSTRNPEFGSAVISALSLGFGAQFRVVKARWCIWAPRLRLSLQKKFSLPDWGRRTPSWPAAWRAAVSASFNAPIAGVLFAHEVVLGPLRQAGVHSHCDLIGHGHDCYPAVGLAMQQRSRSPHIKLRPIWNSRPSAPAGLWLCGTVAICFQFGLIATDYVARSITIPLWLRPAVGGLMIGCIGVFLPEILGGWL